MNLKCQLEAGQKSMGLPLILRQFQSLRCMLSKYHFRSMFLWQSVTLSQADYKMFTDLRRRSTRWRCQVNSQSLQALRSRCGQFCLGWRNTLQEHWKNCAACDLHLFLNVWVVLYSLTHCSALMRQNLSFAYIWKSLKGITILFLFLNMTQGTEKSMGNIKKNATRLNCLVW